MLQIFPSLISGDLLHLEDQITKIDTHCDGYHIDVMDFHFVPNLTWGSAFVNEIQRVTEKPLDVHLMVDYPEKYFDQMNMKKNDIISFHIESKSTYNPKELINLIHNMSCKAFIALNPQTSIDVIDSFIHDIDGVLLMSVEPGFSGQSFIMSSVDKLKKLHAHKLSHKASFTIAMDGGINSDTLPLIAPHGIQQIGAASAIFKQKDHIQALKDLYHTYNTHI
jgi:ribulose-phosphate 3-epimerase